MFAFTKVVKLVGLFKRDPSDIMYLPVSIVFGYFHGLIKLYALATLKMVSHFLPPPSLPPNIRGVGQRELGLISFFGRPLGVAEPMATSITTSASRNGRSVVKV